MQRLRAGLTGLGLVLLVVMIASLLFTPARAPAPQPAEPLARLGVAPGPAADAPPPARPAHAPARPRDAAPPGGPLTRV